MSTILTAILVFSIAAIIFVAVLALESILDAFIGIMLWQWFITPVFNVLPPSIPIMIGLGLFMRFYANPIKFEEIQQTKEEKENKQPFQKMTTIVLAKLMILALGFVVSKFV